MSDFTVKDSGERREFTTGSVRDRGDLKPRPDYISPFALLEVGEHMRKGAVKYAPQNWQLGQPFSEMTASMYRHHGAGFAADCGRGGLGKAEEDVARLLFLIY